MKICRCLVSHRFGRALKSPWRTAPKLLWLEALQQRSVDGVLRNLNQLGFRWPEEKEKRLMLLLFCPLPLGLGGAGREREETDDDGNWPRRG